MLSRQFKDDFQKERDNYSDNVFLIYTYQNACR